MPISWTEIKSNALTFSEEWKGETREAAEAKPFWEEFFRIFGLKRRLYATFEEPVRKQSGSSGFIDLLWPGVVMVEHKSRGQSLDKAQSQAFDYIQWLGREKRLDEIPRYLILSDFSHFRLNDLESGKEIEFPLEDLYKKVDLFGFMAGYEVHEHHEEDPANFKAVELMAQLKDSLDKSGFDDRELEQFLIRILFCLFAEDTGIFEREAFSLYLKQYTNEDGSDIGLHLGLIFEVLNSPHEKRSKNLEPLIAGLPFVNGGLFEDRLGLSQFDRSMREALMRCTRFDWSRISPVIFGSLFQSVMDPVERRQIGGHYTSEKDIMKVIRSLFLDELWQEFEKIKKRPALLTRFHMMLGNLKFLDPACGCGNFLVVAYRELRKLEIAILDGLHPPDDKGRRQGITDIGLLSLVDVDCMHGIEISKFPAKIAEVAMWLIDHQMNLQLAETFGQYFVRLPLRKCAKIVTTNALRIDWETVVPAKQCDYVLGNPPFVGARIQNKEQKEDMLQFAASIKKVGQLDYVTAWYIKAHQYIERNTNIRVGFVSTNSITQGEQVGVLWPDLLSRGVHIHFGHRTFKWESEAKGKAHVHVVIIGFGLKNRRRKYIFDYQEDKNHPTVIDAKNINPYLASAANVIVTNRSNPICNVPLMAFGNMPNDGGNLLLTDRERQHLVEIEPLAENYIRRCMGAEEFINGGARWCLWLRSVDPSEIRRMPNVLKRVMAVKDYRLASRRAATNKLADFPALFGEVRQPTTSYVLVPLHTSEKRPYIPFGFYPPDVIVHNSCAALANASLFHFGVLSSAMQMAWIRQVAGRLESRYRYSVKLVYNNFPWPDSPPEKAVQIVEVCAEAVLTVRDRYPDSTLADLYDPLTMPADLVRAHRRLDKAVDKLFRRTVFTGDLDRFQHLIELYRVKVEGMIPAEKATRKRRAPGKRTS